MTTTARKDLNRRQARLEQQNALRELTSALAEAKKTIERQKAVIKSLDGDNQTLAIEIAKTNSIRLELNQALNSNKKLSEENFDLKFENEALKKKASSLEARLVTFKSELSQWYATACLSWMPLYRASSVQERIKKMLGLV